MGAKGEEIKRSSPVPEAARAGVVAGHLGRGGLVEGGDARSLLWGGKTCAWFMRST